MSTIKFNQWLNPDNTENYKCRAWVNFKGTGTVAIRASGNVSSITDNAVGDFTINFTNPMPNVDYAFSGVVGRISTDTFFNILMPNLSRTKTVSALPVITKVSNAPLEDSTFNYVIVHG